MRASFSCIYVTPTVTASYEQHYHLHPSDPGDPQNPSFLKKTREVFQYLVMELGSENLILCSYYWGDIKLVKLATIYIKVRAEGQRTTTGNQSRARSIHLKDPLPRLWLLHCKF